MLIYGKSLPKKSQVHSRFFERENIVEMIVLEVEKDFALKSKFEKNYFFRNNKEIFEY